MDIKKVIIGLVFSMLFGSGVAVAANADDGGLSQQELFLALADTAVGSGDHDKAVKLYKDAFGLGSVRAAHELGKLYALGKGPIKDIGVAILYWIYAIDRGYGESAQVLSSCYEGAYGDGGCDVDMKRSIQFLREAITLGYDSSAVILGNRYWYGRGVELNRDRAIQWYKYAAQAGEMNGAAIIGEEYLGSSYLKRDIDQAEIWLTLAAKKGQTRSQSLLSDLYLDDSSGKYDPVMAYVWASMCQHATSLSCASNKLLLEGVILTDKEIAKALAAVGELRGTLDNAN